MLCLVTDIFCAPYPVIRNHFIPCLYHNSAHQLNFHAVKYFIPFLIGVTACTTPPEPVTTSTIDVDTLPPLIEPTPPKLVFPNPETPLEHAYNMADTSDTYTLILNPVYDRYHLDSAGWNIAVFDPWTGEGWGPKPGDGWDD